MCFNYRLHAVVEFHVKTEKIYLSPKHFCTYAFYLYIHINPKNTTDIVRSKVPCFDFTAGVCWSPQ